MTKSIVRTDEELERLINDPDFDEEAFEREYFPEGSLEKAYEQGRIVYCNGDGVLRKMEPPKKAARKTKPASRVRAESLDNRLLEKPAFAAK